MSAAGITSLFPVVHGIVIICLISWMLLFLLRKQRPAGYVFPAGLFFLSVNLALIIISAKRLPLYGIFESFTLVLWVLGICLYLSSKAKASAESALCGGVMLFLSVFMCLFPFSLNQDYFMYASPWVQSFFFFRILSAGVVLYAGLRFSAGYAENRISKNRIFQLRQQHMFLLAGTVLYLVSELSGSIWCLKGWGDSWNWSENFFQSAAIFFLLMINFHVPSALLRSPGKRSVFGILTSFIVVFLILG